MNCVHVGSGCGSVGRPVASHTRDPWFKSSHRQIFKKKFELYSFSGLLCLPLCCFAFQLKYHLSLSFSYYTSSFCLQNISTTYCPAVKSFHAFDLFSSPPQSICLPVFCNLSFYPVSTILDSLISTTLP